MSKKTKVDQNTIKDATAKRCDSFNKNFDTFDIQQCYYKQHSLQTLCRYFSHIDTKGMLQFEVTTVHLTTNIRLKHNAHSSVLIGIIV